MSIEDHHLYRSIRELIDREAAAAGMTGPQVAQVLIAILAEVIEAAPDQAMRTRMAESTFADLVERVGKNLPLRPPTPPTRQ
jgi:hypothetical protein